MASSSSRTVLWIAAALVAVAIVGAVLVSRVEAPAPAPSAPVASAQPAPPPSTAAAPAAPRAEPARQVHVEGQGAATVVSTDANQSIPPPDAAVDDPSVNPPIEPEKPQTPEWKLEKTTRIVQLIDLRLVRLEKHIQDAEARGLKATADETRVLLERSRKRRGELQQEIEALKEQIRASGGTPAEVAGSAKP